MFQAMCNIRAVTLLMKETTISDSIEPQCRQEDLSGRHLDYPLTFTMLVIGLQCFPADNWTSTGFLPMAECRSVHKGSSPRETRKIDVDEWCPATQQLFPAQSTRYYFKTNLRNAFSKGLSNIHIVLAPSSGLMWVFTG